MGRRGTSYVFLVMRVPSYIQCLFHPQGTCHPRWCWGEEVYCPNAGGILSKCSVSLGRYKVYRYSILQFMCISCLKPKYPGIAILVYLVQLYFILHILTLAGVNFGVG